MVCTECIALPFDEPTTVHFTPLYLLLKTCLHFTLLTSLHCTLSTTLHCTLLTTLHCTLLTTITVTHRTVLYRLWWTKTALYSTVFHRSALLSKYTELLYTVFNRPTLPCTELLYIALYLQFTEMHDYTSVTNGWCTFDATGPIPHPRGQGFISILKGLGRVHSDVRKYRLFC